MQLHNDWPLSRVHSQERRGRVALLGPYHSRNLGDTATQMSVIQNLSARRTEIEIVGVSTDPLDTARSLGIPAFPLSGRGPDSLPANFYPNREGSKEGDYAVSRIRRFLRSIDLLIVSGGGQMDDFWGGAWGHPYLLLLWATCARLQGVRVAVVGVGVDRLDSVLSRAFARWTLRLAQYRSFRDTGSLDKLRKSGWRGEAHVCPDLAFALDTASVRVAGSTGAPFAVISPISHATWSAKENLKHTAYIEQLEAAGIWLSKRGLDLRILCSQAVMDGGIAARLATTLSHKVNRPVAVHEAPACQDFIRAVQGARIVIASRLHAVILSLVAGTPVVAISPLRKVSQVMRDAGLQAYCEELQSVTAETLISKLASALNCEEELRVRVADYAKRSRAMLRRTFDDVDRLIGEAIPSK